MYSSLQRNASSLNAYKAFSLGILMCLLSAPALSQKDTGKRWYFGNSTSGIVFNRSTDSASLVADQATPFGTGGSAVAIDPANANLLFYSDGATVYDALHGVMPNGSGLTANSSAHQPVAISPVPGNADTYYVFTNSADYPTGGEVFVSVVDMQEVGNAAAGNVALGDVIVANTPVGLTNRSEAMIVVPHANGNDFWLITHETSTATYAATLIDSATYSSGSVGAFNTVTSIAVGNPLAAARFTHSAALQKIAVSPQSFNDNALVLDFDNNTGSFSFDVEINNTASTDPSADQSVYDMAWSPGGRYLYLSLHGNSNAGADLLQYDYRNAGNTGISVLPNPVHRSYGLQMAVDTAIYHLYQTAPGGPFLLGRLTDTDSIASNVVYDTIPLGNNDFAGTQFPVFLPSGKVDLNVSFTSQGTCQNAPTTFFATVTPAADSLIWDFGDGTTGRGASPIHTYQQPQTYTVSLTAFCGTQRETVTGSVSITSSPLSIQLVQDTTACRSEFPPPRGTSTPQQFSVTATIQGGTPTSTVWSNGNNTPTLFPDSAGYYYLVATDASGCSTYAGVNVKEYDFEDQRANIWYFGDRAGIDFNPLPNAPPAPLDNSAMNAPEGTSTMSDRNGDVIFYTDGDKVYDKTHTEIATGIGGDPASAQAALIVPVPDDETLYYIFTTKAMTPNSSYELRYSLFDIKENNGNGAVVQQNVLLYAKSSERLTANAMWLISHEYGNNTFRAYPITRDGIGDPVFSSIGSVHSFSNRQTGEGYMKLHSNDTLAVALSDPGASNQIEVFAFDNNEGTLDNYKKIDLNEPNGQVYGVAFSPGGKKIYATLRGSGGTPSAVYEYYFDANGDPVLSMMTPAPGQELGAMQRGPDGQLYMAINGETQLGTIQAVESENQVSGVNFAGFALAAGTTSGLGLPNFAQIVSTSANEPDMTFANTCLGDTTSFSATTTDIIDEVQWDFGDGAFSTDKDALHAYSNTGDYTVTLRIVNRCGLDTTLTRTITIYPNAEPPTIPGAVTLCTGPIVLDANSNNLPGYTYQWSSGQTTQTISVNAAAIVSVTNTNADGCRATAETFVSDNRPILDLGPDVTVCATSTSRQLDALNPGADYIWTLNGNNTGNTTQFQDVDLSAPGTYTYEVTITDPFTSCFRVEDKAFTVVSSPSFTFSGVDPSTCNVQDGSINLQINPSQPPGRRYTYSLTGPGVNRQGIDQPANTTLGPITGLGAGSFTARLTDQASGCAADSTVGLSDPGSFTANVTSTNCNPTTLEVSIASGNPVAPILYTYTNHSTGQSVGPTTSNTAQFSPSDGDYTVQVHDDNGTGCRIVLTRRVAITSNNIVITESVCSDPATLTASLNNAIAYSWTGPGIVSGADSNTITLNASGLYEVTATIPGCTASKSQEVIYGIQSDFTQSDACTFFVFLTGTPEGNYTYRWYKEGVFQPNRLGRIINIGRSEDGANYAFEAVSAINGCAYRSADKRVNVVGPVDASIDPVSVCDDGSPFTLNSTTRATGTTYSWFFNGNLLPNQNNSTTTQTRAGQYRVDITKSVCTTSATLDVVKLPLPQKGNLVNEAAICDSPENTGIQDDRILLDPGDYLRYEWFIDGAPTGITDRTLTATSAGEYTVVVSDSNNCSNTDKTTVVSQCIPVIEGPNAFRPSSSLTPNKNFSLFTFFITNTFSIFIYNRWGELVYQSNDRFFKWDGRHQHTDTLLPPGSYAYVVKYVDASHPERGTQEKRGGVVLIR